MAAVILEPTAETETLVWEREGAAACQLLIAQSYWSTGQLVKAKVKSGQTVKYWLKEMGLFANIDIFGCLCKIGLQD